MTAAAYDDRRAMLLAFWRNQAPETGADLVRNPRRWRPSRPSPFIDHTIVLLSAATGRFAIALSSSPGGAGIVTVRSAQPSSSILGRSG